MKHWSRAALSLLLFALVIYPTSTGANVTHQDTSMRLVKVLSDHPGAATALTSKQKLEIREFLAKGEGNQNMVCKGLSLAGQSESMYKVVRLRAQLVCKYARSINPSIKTSLKEKTIKSKRLNGRVEIVSF
jgi:hypothetical protein